MQSGAGFVRGTDTTISINVVDGDVVLNDSVNVVAVDVLATNGVAHVIDAVVVPQVVLDALSQ